MAYKNIVTGIYQIINLTNNKSYVGSASNIRQRWSHHKRNLSNNKHHSSYLQNAWNKYGESVFVLKILTTCIKDKDILIELEQFYIDTLKPEYNIAKIAGSCLGIKLSPERKLQISESLKGRICSEETKRKISYSQKGKVISLESRQKLSNTLQKRSKEKCLETKLKRSSFTIEQIKDIKQMLLDKRPMTECMQKYNVSRTPIYNIKTGQAWTEIQL